MRKSEIKVGGHYRAKVSGKLTTVRVERIGEAYNGRTRYDVTNLTTGRNIMFRSAAKFRAEVKEPVAFPETRGHAASANPNPTDNLSRGTTT